MRIIGGVWRHRTILAPRGLTTRPMPDRVRHAVFETVGSRCGTPGALPPLRVLDLFSGSGSVGLEALSRGAAWCGFVDRDRAALASLRRNIAALLESQAGAFTQVLDADAFDVPRWSRRLRGGALDLVFVDPPYADSRDAAPDGRVGRLLADLAESPSAADGVLVVLRHEARVAYDQHSYGALRALSVRRYGAMAVTYLTPEGS